MKTIKIHTILIVGIIALPLLTGCVYKPFDRWFTTAPTTEPSPEPPSLDVNQQIVAQMVTAKLQGTGLPYTSADISVLVDSILSMVKQGKIGKVDGNDTAQLTLAVTDLVDRWRKNHQTQ